MPPISLRHAYFVAKATVIQSGYGQEVHWQDTIQFRETTESDFLREAAWVVLSSGMRESVIRAKFPRITTAFLSWISADSIWRKRKSCARRALSVFGHQGKIQAVVEIARRVSTEGFDATHERLQAEGIEYIRTFPYLGPATAYHLAKNIGIDVAKPDRHLLRVAEATGFDTPASLCMRLSQLVGDKPSVVDLVIWRYATLETRYLDLFRRVAVAELASPRATAGTYRRAA